MTTRAPRPNWLKEARGRYPDADDMAWIDGNGRWATVAWCGGLTVDLWATREAAQRGLDAITPYGCGHACWGDHELVDLAAPALVGPDESYRMDRRLGHFEQCRVCGYLHGQERIAAAIGRHRARMWFWRQAQQPSHGLSLDVFHAGVLFGFYLGLKGLEPDARFLRATELLGERS